MEGVRITTVNYSGHSFADFYVNRDPGGGPGWFVFGRNSEKYGTLPNGKGAYVMRCAEPDRPHRKCPLYNGEVTCGWRLKRDAQAIADAMNGGER